MAKITRRDLLKTTAFTSLGLAAGIANAETPKPSVPAVVKPERLRIGIVGSGGKGWSGMEWAAEYGDIVAICDVDANERTRAMLQHPRAVSFQDYRDLYDVYSKNLDAVVISTPDHHHFPASYLALQHGLHTYCEKPLTRTIWEARELGNLARKKGLATQMGNQSTASTNMRKTAALIKNGTFGHVKEIYLWTDRAGGWWAQGMDRPSAERAPKTLDWYLWLGPRPDRDYGKGYHPFAWRGFWDFGTGSLGDMGCHIFNMPHMALDLSAPTSVQAQTSGHNRDSFPSWAIVTYKFPQLGSRPPFTLTWHDGGKKPDQSLVPGETFGGNGVIVVCENATIYSPDSNNTDFRIVGGGSMPDYELQESPGHMAEFCLGAQGGPDPVANFPNYASPLTETVLLGNLAIWADGPEVNWDSKNLRTPGTDEFNSLIRPDFKAGWKP